MAIEISDNDFGFDTDDESVNYLRQIVEIMMKSFGITREEAVGRINQSWGHIQAVVGDDYMYHEFPEYWANHFMFGHDSFWWIKGAARDLQGLPPLKPLPYLSGKEGV